MRYEMKFLEFLFTSEVLIGLLINAKVSWLFSINKPLRISGWKIKTTQFHVLCVVYPSEHEDTYIIKALKKQETPERKWAAATQASTASISTAAGKEWTTAKTSATARTAAADMTTQRPLNCLLKNNWCSYSPIPTKAVNLRQNSIPFFQEKKLLL